MPHLPRPNPRSAPVFPPMNGAPSASLHPIVVAPDADGNGPKGPSKARSGKVHPNVEDPGPE